MGRTSVVMRGRGRHMVFVVVHALPGGSHEADTSVRGACETCGGRVGWYAETYPLGTVAIPTIARDERQESE